MYQLIEVKLVSIFDLSNLFGKHIIHGLIPNRHYTIFTQDGQSSFMSPIFKTNNNGEGVVYTKATQFEIRILSKVEKSAKMTRDYLCFLQLLPESNVFSLTRKADNFDILPKSTTSFVRIPCDFPSIDNCLSDLSNCFIGEEDMERGISISNMKMIGNKSNMLLMNYGPNEVKTSSIKIYFLSRCKEGITDSIFTSIMSSYWLDRDIDFGDK